MKKRFTRWLSFLTVCFILAHFSSPAQAALQAVGPTDLVTTLPSYYQDLNGLPLVPCIDQNGFCILGPPFSPLTPPFTPITTTGPINDLNFPFEAFYYWADAALIPIEGGVGQPKGDRVRLTYVLEYAFLRGVAPNGAITFLRTDIQKMINLAPNSTYRVTHPYGVLTFATDALGATAAGGGVAIRQEDPFGSPLQWMPPQMQSAAFTNIGPFLTRPTGNVVDPISGHTYIGDSRTYTPVTGSPTGNNFVRVERLDATGVPVAGASWQTSNFALAGRVFTGQIPSPLAIDRATYARDAVTGQVDVFVTALPTAFLSISGTTGLASTSIPQDVPNTGKFFAHFPVVGALPTGVSITNSLDVPPIAHPVTLVDEVTISQAIYSSITKNLTITANSRDNLAPLPILTVTAFGAAHILDPITGTVVVPLPLNTIPPMNVTVTSANGGSATIPVSVVDLVPVVPVVITNAPTLTPYTLGAGAYAATTLTATGGTAPYTWAVAPLSTLPAGLLLTGNVLSGTPTAAGTFSFSLQVTDSAAPAVTTVQVFTLVVSPAPAPALVINTATLANGVVGAAYSQTLAATGGTVPYTWAVAPLSTLPAGLGFTAGVLSGTPTVAGTFNFSLQVTDTALVTAIKAFTLVVSPAPAPALVINTATLANGVVGAVYSQTLAATGGTVPYTWAVAPLSTLPAGLGFTAGVLSGTPTAAGTFNFSLQVTDTALVTAIKAFTLVVTAPVVVVPATGATLVPGLASPQVAGTPITFTAAATGGDAGPYEYRFFWRQNNTATFTEGRAYSTTPTWTWNTAGLPKNNYVVRVDVRHVGSTAAFESNLSVNYKLK